MSDSRDRARLEAIFLEPINPSETLYHLVWNDEYRPVADEEYRRLRQERFGRTTDVETIHGSLSDLHFPRNYSGPQPYNSAFHLTASRDRTDRIFVRTWNHMLNTRPNPRAQYLLATPQVLTGTREAAESFTP